MLEKVNLKASITKEEYKKEASTLKEELSSLQQLVKQNKLPVIIVFEGWGSAGKGSQIANLILNFDPRGSKVYSNIAPTELEKREPTCGVIGKLSLAVEKLQLWIAAGTRKSPCFALRTM